MPRYLGLVHHERDGTWRVAFPDLRDCTASARSLDALRPAAREAIERTLREITASGAPPPPASDREKLATDPRTRGALLLAVEL
jgi:predicted RNase H-like HicB family nuclease